MVNTSEQKIKSMIEAKGYDVFHKGAPDFLCIKCNKETRIIDKVVFVEVKPEKGRISESQLYWNGALKLVGANAEFVNSDDPKSIERLLKKL